MSSIIYLPSARNGYRLGDGKLVDGLVFDGLTDVYNQYHMGVAAELCAKECGFTREAQDEYAVNSYKRSAAAWAAGKFNNEVSVEIKDRKGNVVLIKEDEEYKNVNLEKIPTLKCLSRKTEVRINACTLNDGASALVLMSKAKAEKFRLKPLAKECKLCRCGTCS